MGTIWEDDAGRSGNAALPVIRPSDAAFAAYELWKPYEAAATALWLDATPQCILGAGQGDPGALFSWLDRCGGRQFKPDVQPANHPITAVDDLSHKAVVVFGIGGTGTNVLSNNPNGNLSNPSILDAGGVERNRIRMLLPGGYTFAAKFRMPAVGGTYLGFATVVNYPGGSILGGSAVPSANASGYWGINQDNGFFEVRHRNNVAIWTGTTDLRDGNFHTALVSYNATTQALKVWVDGVLVGNAAGVVTDLINDTDALPRIAAFGDTTGGALASDRFSGALAFIGFLPAPVIEADAARAAVQAMLAEL